MALLVNGRAVTVCQTNMEPPQRPFKEDTGLYQDIGSKRALNRLLLGS